MDKSKYSFADLEQWFNDRRVTEIECLVPDLTGVARGKILPREKFTEDGTIVADLQDPAGAYPETTAVTETPERLYVQSLHAAGLGWMKR